MVCELMEDDFAINETIVLMQLKKALAPWDFDKLKLENLQLLRNEVKERLDKLTEEDDKS